MGRSLPFLLLNPEQLRLHLLDHSRQLVFQALINVSDPPYVGVRDLLLILGELGLAILVRATLPLIKLRNLHFALLARFARCRPVSIASPVVVGHLQLVKIQIAQILPFQVRIGRENVPTLPRLHRAVGGQVA